jgi:hypothetical protein
MSNKDKRLCRNCKWCKEPGEFAKCYHPKIPVISLQNIQDSPKGFH